MGGTAHLGMEAKALLVGTAHGGHAEAMMGQFANRLDDAGVRRCGDEMHYLA